MKTHQSRHPHDTLQTALRSAFPIDARRLEVLAALILAMVQARSVVLYTLKTHVQLPGSLDTRYQRLRRFVRFPFPEHLFARFALSFLPHGELHLILDRTNWKLGSQDVNILLLSAVWDGFSLPLMWTLLPHGGCSSQQVREELLTRFLQCCPERSVSSLLADREFIGKSWFTFLDQHRIAPCIRLPATATVGTGNLPVWACFKKLQVGEIRCWHRRMVVYGVSLRLCATKNTAGEVLYLAYRGHASVNLRRYAQRWQAEMGQLDYGDTSRTSGSSNIEVALLTHCRCCRAPMGSALKTWSRLTSASSAQIRQVPPCFSCSPFTMSRCSQPYNVTTGMFSICANPSSVHQSPARGGRLEGTARPSVPFEN